MTALPKSAVEALEALTITEHAWQSAAAHAPGAREEILLGAAEAAAPHITAADTPAAIATAVHQAFCWLQPDDGRLVACDRHKDHKGLHSWEFPAPSAQGVYGRIELPGYRENEGWVTEETRFGMQVAVVRNRAGQVTAEVTLGPACRFVHLPEPEPEAERPALPAGSGHNCDDSCADPWHGERDEDGMVPF